MNEGMTKHAVRNGWWQVRYRKRLANCKSEHECEKIIGLAEWMEAGSQGNRPKGNATLESKAKWLLKGCGH